MKYDIDKRDFFKEPFSESELKKIIQNLWTLFQQENAILAEINPLFETLKEKLNEEYILSEEELDDWAFELFYNCNNKSEIKKSLKMLK